MLVSQTENSSRVLLSILSFCLQHFLRITTFLDRYPALRPEFIAYGGTTPICFSLLLLHAIELQV